MPQRKNRREIAGLINELHHQLARGTHTYSLCKAHKIVGRSGTCPKCVVEQLIAIRPEGFDESTWNKAVYGLQAAIQLVGANETILTGER